MIPDENVLLENLGKVAYTLDKAYISRLMDDYHVLPFDTGYNANGDVCYVSNIRALKINRWVFDQSERPSECLKNVLSLFADGDHALGLVVIRKHYTTDMYFVVKNQGPSRNGDSRNNIDLLSDSIYGNFPGTSSTIMGVKEIQKLFSFEGSRSVAVLSNTPSEYSKDYVTQGLEKLLNGIVPDESGGYAVVFLADSLSTEDIRDIVSGYEEIATAMYPFAGYQFQASKNKSEIQGEMRSIADSKSVSDSVSKTHSVHAGASLGIKDVAGANGGYGYGWGSSKTQTSGKTELSGANSSVSVGTSDTSSYSYKSYLVADLVAKIEQTIQRLTKSQSTGLWKFATYVFSDDPKTSKNVAGYIRAITQGKDSYIQPSAIQEWHKAEGGDGHIDDFDHIRSYLSHFTHPIFYPSAGPDNDKLLVTPTSYVGTEEVSNVIVFPKTSVPGIPVFECVSFGRNVVSFDDEETTGKEIGLGPIFHMHRVEPVEVKLNLQSLASHTFITGSTGAGKTNTVCHMLDEARRAGIHFLVVEPAKGEYKTVLGGLEGVSVFGTNPAVAPLLRIDPFSFPDDVHVLEHLDRLVEVFNVCWPMYAAMPSILKAALERSYEECGWDLVSSTNPYGDRLFPNFSDVARNVRTIMDTSEYDTENKGAYKGSLLTRLQSLSNGINGFIFGPGEIEPDILFESDVIVDLSRVGSLETKSLIMGMLVLKLQEYRMVTSCGANLPLQHLTVLEEAHNLLRRTSTEQPVEGGNLMGKSVEMLSNAIAEMRTYGEGFVIADQAPGLLDLAAIRNTNTKIIMRLPDLADRELVGRAANLNDYQIVEVARLPMGVAAVYQNNWVQPVLCKIERASTGHPFEYEAPASMNGSSCAEDSLMLAEILSTGTRLDGSLKLDEIRAAMQRLNLSSYTRVEILRSLASPPSEPRMTKLGPLMSALFPEVKAAVVRERRESAYDPESWTVSASVALSYMTQQAIDDQVRRDIIQAIITDHIFNELHDARALRDWSERGGLR